MPLSREKKKTPKAKRRCSFIRCTNSKRERESKVRSVVEEYKRDFRFSRWASLSLSPQTEKRKRRSKIPSEDEEEEEDGIRLGYGEVNKTLIFPPFLRRWAFWWFSRRWKRTFRRERTHEGQIVLTYTHTRIYKSFLFLQRLWKFIFTKAYKGQCQQRASEQASKQSSKRTEEWVSSSMKSAFRRYYWKPVRKQAISSPPLPRT